MWSKAVASNCKAAKTTLFQKWLACGKDYSQILDRHRYIHNSMLASSYYVTLILLTLSITEGSNSISVAIIPCMSPLKTNVNPPFHPRLQVRHIRTREESAVGSHDMGSLDAVLLG